MKIVGKILIGLAGLVGGALIERGVSGYAEDISDMRKPKDEIPEDGDTAEASEQDTETSEPEIEPEVVAEDES